MAKFISQIISKALIQQILEIKVKPFQNREIDFSQNKRNKFRPTEKNKHLQSGF